MSQRPSLSHERYLGDGVAAGFDGYHIWIFLAEGHQDRSAKKGIALEPIVMDQLKKYERDLREKLSKEGGND